MIQEKIIVGQGGAYPLDGMLTLPGETSGPFPAAVFVHGSGTSDMDEHIGGLYPFRDLAEGLAAHGIASIRYDKRSFKYHRKIVKKGEQITVKEETIDDAILAAELLRKDSRIDPGSIYIVGHSMGAMLAPRIDAAGGNFRGMVLMAGTPRTMGEVVTDQLHDMSASMNAVTRFLMSGQIKKFERIFAELDSIPDEEAKRRNYGGGVTLYYFKEIGRYDAAELLMATEKPVLILQGGKDFQVSPEKDFNAYKERLAGRPNTEYRLFPELNHVFVKSVYGDINKAMKEYKVPQKIGEEVISVIADWIHRQAALTGSGTGAAEDSEAQAEASA